MTFKEWETTRDDSIKFAQETIESMKGSIDPELSKLFGTAYNDAVTDEIRDYNKNIMMTLTEGDLYQIAAALNKIAEGSVNTPRIMFKNPEATPRGYWIPMEYDTFKCSICGETSCCETNYCPDCGAKMKDDNDDE